ncbi:prepilin-type N-terminal cleavage/methylation domain-containing protein [Dactylosporangium sp. NPDC051485]|uniref:type II secretion system protein n=1 Tax=Dactylosporangium sp. NPDC051485 TaxID=3154846 RepID=UPI00343C6300
MLQRLRSVRENESGFTLIELLIVIVILGILSGIVVFAVGAFNDRGTMAACKTDVKNVEVAVEAYKAKSADNKYPADLATLVPNYLREEPKGNGYTITYVASSGAVTGALTDGTACK